MRENCRGAKPGQAGHRRSGVRRAVSGACRLAARPRPPRHTRSQGAPHQRGQGAGRPRGGAEPSAARRLPGHRRSGGPLGLASTIAPSPRSWRQRTTTGPVPLFRRCRSHARSPTPTRRRTSFACFAAPAVRRSTPSTAAGLFRRNAIDRRFVPRRAYLHQLAEAFQDAYEDKLGIKLGLKLVAGFSENASGFYGEAWPVDENGVFSDAATHCRLRFPPPRRRAASSSTSWSHTRRSTAFSTGS